MTDTRFFGSGVILATSLVHLLEPAADDELGPANTIALGGCISNAWAAYPYAVSDRREEEPLTAVWNLPCISLHDICHGTHRVPSRHRLACQARHS